MTSFLRFGRVALMLLCVAAAAAETRADVKIKSRQTMQGQTYENATYIKGKRQRTEQMGGQTVSIQQCDLRRDLQLMPAMKAYTVNPYDNGAPQTAPAPGTTTKVERTQGGVVNMTVTTKDTGERKQMFGYTARHLIITTEMKSSPESCNPVDMKMETDGWYIDAAFQLECDAERSGRYYNPQQAGGCRDRYETKTIGTAKRGFPLWEKLTMFDKDGRETMSWVNEVIELSQATLDASLFEAPADYREVKDFSAAAMMSSQSYSSNNGGPNGSANNGSAQQSPDPGTSAGMGDISGSQSQQAPAELGPKKPGVVRLGLASVKTGAVGEAMNAATLAAAVQNTLAAHLKGPAVELVQLEAKLPAQVEEEARQKECDFVVYANVSHKKGGGGFGGMFNKVMAPAIGQVGYGHTGSTAGNIAAGAATTAVISAGAASANVKQKDELTLDIKLQAPGNATAAAARQFKSKAKSAGEDIITPAVEQAAQMILDAAGSSRQ